MDTIASNAREAQPQLASLSTEEGQEELAGYTSLPNSFLQALGGKSGSTQDFARFVAINTIGRQIKIGNNRFRVKNVCLSFDEFIHGRKRRNGSRMQFKSGLKDDKAVGRGAQGALASGLVEIVDTGQRGVCIYTTPDHFWQEAGFLQAILMLFDSRIPNSHADYRLIDIPTAGKTTADETGDNNASASTAGKMTAVLGQNDSSAGNNASSSAAQMTAEILPQAAQEAARDERKHTSQHRVFNIERNKDIAASPRAPDVAPVEKEDQKELGSEEESRDLLIPSAILLMERTKGVTYLANLPTPTRNTQIALDTLIAAFRSYRDEPSTKARERFNDCYHTYRFALEQANEPATSLASETRVSEPAGSERQDVPEQPTRQAPTKATWVPKSADEARRIANSGELARMFPGKSQNVPAAISSQPSADVLQAAHDAMHAQPADPKKVIAMRPRNKRADVVASYQAHLNDLDSKIAHLDEVLRAGGEAIEIGGEQRFMAASSWDEDRKQQLEESRANYRLALRAMENGVSVEEAQRIAQGQIPDAAQQLAMYGISGA